MEQVDGVVGIADNVADYAKSKEEHDKILHKLIQVARKNRFVFNSTKFTIRSKSLFSYGMIYTMKMVLGKY